MSRLRQVDFNPANMSAFGTLESSELTPVVQYDFIYGLNSQIWQSPVVSGAGAAVDISDGRLRIQSGTNAAGYSYVLPRKPIIYRPGQGITLRYTPLFTAGVADNVQAWGAGAVVANALYDGYFYAYNGVDFGIIHYVRGTQNWIPQSTWNQNKVNGSAGSAFTLNPVYGSPMMIKYPYLGYGNINFFIQKPNGGNWVLVHQIQYANTTIATQLSNPRLYFLGYTQNSGNTSNVTMYCGSVGAFISGPRSFVTNPKWPFKNAKNAVTTETNILTVKNATTYNGVANRGLIRVNSITISSSAATGTATFTLKLNATLGGTPAYTPRSGSTADNGATITSGNSIASFDTAGTTVTGGIPLWSIVVDNPNSSGKIDLSDEDIFIAPGETLTLSGESSNASELGATLNESEDI